MHANGLIADDRHGSRPYEGTVRTHPPTPDDNGLEMVVVTPSWAPDLELFSDLHESVLRCFPRSVRHLVVTAERDQAAFRRFEGPRCEVLSTGDVLPRHVKVFPPTRMRVNLRRPVPPLRGWIVQQLVKLALAEQLEEKVIVVVDSDVVFLRPVTVSVFAPHGHVRFYRKDGGVSKEMARHVRWHEVARALLGLPPAPPLPLPDYISALNAWDRDLVIAALRHIEDATGRPWLTAVGRNVHFSEFILYGVFVDEIARPDASVVTDDPLCHFYWDTVPLTVDTGLERLGSIKPADVAVMISAKSNTPMPVRRAMLAELTAP
jgi:hypothetical protein